MATLYTPIDPTKDKVIVGGIQIVGFADDTKLTVSRDNDVMNKKVGVDGDVLLNINQDRTGTLVIRLLETSPSNDVFAGYLGLMRAGGAKGVTSFVVERAGSYSSINGGQCWIQSQPDRTFGAEGAVYEWTLGVFDTEVGVQGIGEQLADITGL